MLTPWKGGRDSKGKPLRELVITFVRRGPILSGLGARGGGGGGYGRHHLSHITDKILLAVKFELTQKYSTIKTQHC